MQRQIGAFMFIAFFMSSVAGFCQSNDDLAIRKILSDQVTSWNKGNLEEFMQGYWKNDSLQFIGKTGVTYGWEQTLQNYKTRFPDTTVMGKLAFDLLQIKPLADAYYFVLGKWRLTRTIGNVNGHFTLLFKKINNRWLIISDHSS